jgi:hypothetical protein
VSKQFKRVEELFVDNANLAILMLSELGYSKNI